jgi:hypothetical protein
MKALAIIALVFGGLSIFIPVGGVFIAMVCGLFALVAFRTHPTLAGVTFGINIINTAFLSPSIMLSDAAASGSLGTVDGAGGATTEAGEIYWFYVGFHLVLFAIAIIWRMLRGAPNKISVETE